VTNGGVHVGITDMVIAKNLYEMESLDRSQQAIKALHSISDGLRQQSSAMSDVVCSVSALAEVERRNGTVLGEINSGLGLISDELYEGFSKLAYEQRLQSESLRGILAALSSPSAVQAREFRDRGMYAYANDWAEEAEHALQNAIEHDPFDFTVHQVLGDMALREGRSREASDRFAAAARYALPVSVVDSAYALMSQSRALRSCKDFAAAQVVATDAAALLPESAEAHYAVAQAAFGAGALEAASGEMRTALELNPGLGALLAADEAFALDGDFATGVLSRFRDDLLAQTGEPCRVGLATIRQVLDGYEVLNREHDRLVRENLARRETKPKGWFRGSEPTELLPEWFVQPELYETALRLHEVGEGLGERMSAGSIVDLVLARDLIEELHGCLIPRAAEALSGQYLQPGLSREAARVTLDTLLAVKPGAVKTAPCPKCGFRITEWDDICRSCLSLFKERMAVPSVLAHAYDAWLTDERHWPTFLARLDACSSSLPKGPGARDRIYARFPKAAGKAGFADVVARVSRP